MAVFSHSRIISLGMTPQTKIAVAGNQHFILDRTVNLMAGRTAFTQGLMLPDKWATLLFVTFKTGFVNVFQRCCGPRTHLGAVCAVTIRTAHMTFKHGMPIRQTKFCFFIQVAAKAYFGLFPGINNRSFSSA